MKIDKLNKEYDKTSDAGSQYRCGRVGRGSQPPSTIIAPPNPPFRHRHTHKKPPKRLFSHISTRADGPTDRRTDKASYRVACPQLKSKNALGNLKYETVRFNAEGCSELLLVASGLLFLFIMSPDRLLVCNVGLL